MFIYNIYHLVNFTIKTQHRIEVEVELNGMEDHIYIRMYCIYKHIHKYPHKYIYKYT